MTSQIQRLLTLLIYFLPVWLLLRMGCLLAKKRAYHPLREVALAFFAVFMAALLTMVWEGAWDTPRAMLQHAAERFHTGEKIHLRPGHTILPQLRALPSSKALTPLLGNTLLFAPWGFFLPLLWRRFRSPWRMAAMALLLTCTIEGVQLFIGRYVETDDVLLNFLGSMLGAGLWACLHRFFPQTDDLLAVK